MYMISEFNQIKDLWRELDQTLNQSIHLYIIGGAVLVYQGLKPATKDIDLIISTKTTYHSFVNTLKKRRFTQRNPTGVYTNMAVSSIFQRSDYRLDIFLKTVCNKLHLSKDMISRARSIFSGDYLQVFHCSNEDIFLFKSMTEREGDLEDNITLAKTGLNWESIMAEIQAQINRYGNDEWITWIGERFDILEEKGIQIPIMDEINQLRDSYFKRLEKNHLRKP